MPVPVLSKRLGQNVRHEHPASKSLSLLSLFSRWTGPQLWDRVVSKSAFLCHTFWIFIETGLFFKDLKLEFKSCWLKKKEPGRSATEKGSMFLGRKHGNSTSFNLWITHWGQGGGVWQWVQMYTILQPFGAVCTQSTTALLLSTTLQVACCALQTHSSPVVIFETAP